MASWHGAAKLQGVGTDFSVYLGAWLLPKMLQWPRAWPSSSPWAQAPPCPLGAVPLWIDRSVSLSSSFLTWKRGKCWDLQGVFGTQCREVLSTMSVMWWDLSTWWLCLLASSAAVCPAWTVQDARACQKFLCTSWGTGAASMEGGREGEKLSTDNVMFNLSSSSFSNHHQIV